MGAWLQLFLGTVYAWSYFQKPLMEGYGWSNAEVVRAFSLAICCLGLAAGIVGPQIVAVLKDRFPPPQAALYSFAAGAAFLTVGLLFSLLRLGEAPYN